MNVLGYINHSDRKKITKNLTDGLTISNVHMKGSFSVLSPVFLFHATGIESINYLIINDAPFNGRRYFVDDKILLSNGQSEWHCSEDVISTYKNEILAQDCILDRQQNKANAYITDNQWKAECRTNIMTRYFPEGFEDGTSTIITVLGGGH